MIFGEVASQGLARGTAVVYDYVDAPPITCRVIAESEVAQEIARFDAAVAATERDMIAVGRQAEQKHGKDGAAIWGTQLAFLRDPLLRETVHTLCTTKKQNVEAALSEAIATLTATFARLASPYFRERAADLRDVGNRLQQALAQRECPPPSCLCRWLGADCAGIAAFRHPATGRERRLRDGCRARRADRPCPHSCPGARDPAAD